MFSQKDDDDKTPVIPTPTENIPRPVVKKEEPVPEVKKKHNTDLFNAHNFDIKIDLEVPMTSKYNGLFVRFFDESISVLSKVFNGNLFRLLQIIQST